MPNFSSLSAYPNMRAAEPEASTAVTVTLAVSPTAPAHGATVTATYNVAGNGAGTGTPVSVTGAVTVGSASFPVTASFTMPGAPAAAESFAVPACTGLTFQATAQPNVFTAVVP